MPYFDPFLEGNAMVEKARDRSANRNVWFETHKGGVTASRGVVATNHPLASAAGVEAIAYGGGTHSTRRSPPSSCSFWGRSKWFSVTKGVILASSRASTSRL